MCIIINHIMYSSITSPSYSSSTLPSSSLPSPHLFFLPPFFVQWFVTLSPFLSPLLPFSTPSPSPPFALSFCPPYPLPFLHYPSSSTLTSPFSFSFSFSPYHSLLFPCSSCSWLPLPNTFMIK